MGEIGRSNPRAGRIPVKKIKKIMQKLKSLIIAARCRKGPAVDITRHGAFWLACEPILIRSFGGDGVFQSAGGRRNYLQLRHYRSGEVQSVVNYNAWHENHGTSNEYNVVDILDCGTIEEVVAALKDHAHDDIASYADWGFEHLQRALSRLGMPDSAPSPDYRQTTSTAEMREALECIAENTTGNHLPRERVPNHLLAAVEEVLGNGWRTIGGGDAAYLDVDDESIAQTREEYGL